MQSSVDEVYRGRSLQKKLKKRKERPIRVPEKNKKRAFVKYGYTISIKNISTDDEWQPMDHQRMQS